MKRRTFLTLTAAAALAPSTLAAQDEPLRMRDLYNKDQSFSDLARELEGERITMRGFMAPPLKADSKFFVLTKRPMAVCPFCETAAEWPDDIIYVKIPKQLEVVRFNRLLEVEGELSLGMTVDEESGFVSLVRLEDAEYRIKR